MGRFGNWRNHWIAGSKSARTRCVLIRLPPSLVARLDFEAAVRAEVAAPMDALPSRTVESGAESHAKEYATLVGAQCTSGFDVEVQETVQMPKAGQVGRYRRL